MGYVMIARKFVLTAAITIVSLIAGIAVSCKTRSTTSRKKGADTANATSGVAPFAWELADLPACYAKTADAEVYVWRAQKTLKCDKTKGQWM